MRRVDIGEDHRIPSTTEVLPAQLSIYHENINKGFPNYKFFENN